MANFPSDLKYAKTHEWLKIDGDIATLGITDFAQGELSDIVYVEITAVGKTIKRGEPIGTIEAVKAVSDLYSPISGQVLEANEGLKDAPANVNKDPYGAGWMARIKMSDPAELSGLLDSAAYAELARKSAHH
ncbi:glycine cleavage system protein GcvH [candidate division WOR-3 bacterium]|uniref:Glycine cleavage system H protein n=1 Tax=candidate division WOR-3 bacterium TaxID=2052148 RepID=A0A937XCQ6_UNCW3|nr:glycine cleavage system protein GcvH [candidate division WOR-3 bacterium]